MKKILTFATAIMLLAAFTTGRAQSLEKVLDKHFKTIGQDKVLQLKSMKSIGKSNTMGMEVPYITIFKRPNKYYVEVEIQGAKMLQAFDGEIAWMTMPWTGSTEPKQITGPQLQSMETMADFDGPLYNYKEKGYEVELIGKEDMEGTEVFKIKVVMNEELTQYIYMDAENYVILKQASKINFQGTEIDSETYLSNYKTVDGMILPHSMEIHSGGQVSMQINMEKYIFNEDYDDEMFKMPVVEKEEEVEENKEE